MDLEFTQKEISCLRRLLCQSQNREQTQEIRLTEGMADVGKILACWGQVVIRGKEWRPEKILCSAGVMAYVLYAPEDGSTPQTLESWIPFQLKWDLDGSAGDGQIRVQCVLRSLDARIVSARKIMLRCNIGALAEAWREDAARLSVPGELPEDVRLLKNRYPMRIPRIAGEKTFQTEETLTLPGTHPQLDQMISCTLEPRISDTRVVSGKLVFHGTAQIHLVYWSDEGKVTSWNTELPISQFAELDTDMGQEAQGNVTMAVTSLEADGDPEGLVHLKCGMLAQYLVDERENLELVEDAYSTNRNMELQHQILSVPRVLDQKQMTVPVRQTLSQNATEIADVVYLPDLPLIRKEEELTLELPGMFQVLYYDSEGTLCSSAARTEERRVLQTGDQTSACVSLQPGAFASASPGSGIVLNGESDLMVHTLAETGMPMIAGLKLGESYEDGEYRPSLILRRAGSAGLWEIAKQSRSTVDLIRQINHLEDEPEENQILLIPVS